MCHVKRLMLLGEFSPFKSFGINYLSQSFLIIELIRLISGCLLKLFLTYMLYYTQAGKQTSPSAVAEQLWRNFAMLSNKLVKSSGSFREQLCCS